MIFWAEVTVIVSVDHDVLRRAAEVLLITNHLRQGWGTI